MDLYKRQQFEFLLQTAVERLTERLEQRHGGPTTALVRLKTVEGVSEVEAFVDAILQDFLLDNMDGLLFIVGCLPQKRLGSLSFTADQSLQSVVHQIARHQFSALLQSKTIEALEQHSGYQAIDSRSVFQTEGAKVSATETAVRSPTGSSIANG